MFSQSKYQSKIIYIGLVLILSVSLFIIPNQKNVTSQDQDGVNTFPSTFYIVQDDDEFTPVNPLGIKQDQSGNLHIWYMFIEPVEGVDAINDISVYYNIIFANGTNFLVQLIRESLLTTKFPFLQTMDFAEADDGTVYALFIQTTFFSTNIVQFGWSPEREFFTERISYPDRLELRHRIIGPVTNGEFTEFFVNTRNPNAGIDSTFKVQFDSNANLVSTEILIFPQFNLGFTNSTVYDVFDVTYANGSRYYIGSIPISAEFFEIIVYEEDSDGNYQIYARNDDYNVAPAFEGLGFLSGLTAEILVPDLVSTDNGQLFSLLFGFESGSELGLWSDGGFNDVFQDEEQDPFAIAFFPSIEAVGNDIKIASLGFQIAGDVFSISIDIYTYNTVTDELVSKRRVSDNNFSFGLFLFTVDLTDDDLLGFAGTGFTPDYVKDEYSIANDTVGSIFIFSDNEIPEVEPNFIDVYLIQKDDDAEAQIDPRIVVLIVVVSLFAISIVVYRVRSRSLRLPTTIDERRPETVLKKTFLMRLGSFISSQGVYIRANRRRFQISIFVLILPSLILITLFTGIMSHQAHLLESYDAQNPLNYDEEINVNGGDFAWTRLIQDDELTNNTIQTTEFELPRQLSRTTLQTSGLIHTIDRLSSTTVFQLFEARQATFTNDTGQPETFNYPYYHDVAVIEPVWEDYFESNLVAGRLPQAKGEIVVQDSWFVPRDVFNRDAPYGVIWELGSEIELRASVLDLFFQSNIPGLAQNVTVVGILETADNQPFSEIKDWADRLNTTISSLRVLDQFPFYMYPENAVDFLNDYSRMAIQPRTLIDIRHNIDEFERDEIPDLVESYERIRSRTLQQTGFTWLGNFSDTDVIEFLEGYFEASRSVLLEGSVILIPVIGLTMLLTYEALGIGKSSIEEELTRFRREGLRFETYLSLFITERVITSAIATAIAVVFVPISARTLLQFTGFFETNADVIPPLNLTYLLAISLGVFMIMTLVGIVLSVRYLLNLSDWRYQHHLSGLRSDLLLIVGSGLLVWFSSRIADLFEDQLVLDPSENSLDSTSELVVVSLRVLALLLVAFGGALIISKTINRFFIIFGSLLWRRTKSAKGLIFNGISSSMGLYGKTLLVFILAFFLIVPMVIVPDSLNDKYRADSYYEFGTDIIVQDWDQVSNNTKDLILGHPKISESTEFFYGTITFELGIGVQTFAVDPNTYMDSIVIPERHRDKLGFDRRLVDTLQIGEVLVEADFLEDNLFDVGDNLEINYAHIDQSEEVTIAGTYQEFPILRNQPTGVGGSGFERIEFVTSFETLNKIQTNLYFNSTDETELLANNLEERSLAIKTTSFDDAAEVANFIRENAGQRIEFIDQFVENRRHPFFRSFEFISHISIIVGLLAPVLVTIITANVLFERRKFELEVYRRNGVSRGFYLTQLSLELLIATIIPSIIGVPLGYWWSYNYGAELFGETQGSLEWQNNTVLINSAVFSVIVISLVAWITRLLLQSRKHLEEVRL